MIDLSKDRFKTEAELIKEYGVNWRELCNKHFSYWYSYMDFMLGRTFKSLTIKYDNSSILIKSDLGFLIISHDMIFKNIPPNYEPKKLIYD
jgi:hypothetical protein